MNLGIPEIIIILAILGILVLVAFLFVKAILGNRSQIQENRPQSAREVLDLRYSRGEIRKEQYEQMRRDLEG